MTRLSRDDEAPSPELGPPRLLDGGAGEHARRLVASARFDRVPSGARARVAAALGEVLELPASGSGASSSLGGLAPTGLDSPASGPLSPLGARAALGIVGAGIVGAVALTLCLHSAWEEHSRPGSPPPTTSAPSPPARHDPEPNALLERDVSARDESARDVSARAAPPVLSRQRASLRSDGSVRTRVKNDAEPTRAEPTESGLLAEVRALESVSSALAAGEADRAAHELAAYRRRFAHGELAIEADVLDIQAALARGDRDTASARAERLLARPDAEHYRVRVRSLLGTKEAGSAAPSPRNSAGSNDAAAHMRARR